MKTSGLSILEIDVFMIFRGADESISRAEKKNMKAPHLLVEAAKRVENTRCRGFIDTVRGNPQIWGCHRFTDPSMNTAFETTFAGSCDILRTHNGANFRASFN